MTYLRRLCGVYHYSWSSVRWRDVPICRKRGTFFDSRWVYLLRWKWVIISHEKFKLNLFIYEATLLRGNAFLSRNVNFTIYCLPCWSFFLPVKWATFWVEFTIYRAGKRSTELGHLQRCNLLLFAHQLHHNSGLESDWQAKRLRNRHRLGAVRQLNQRVHSLEASTGL
jgi:hypothetical protein